MNISKILDEFRGKTFSSVTASEAWLSGRLEELVRSAPADYLISGKDSPFDKGHNASVDNIRRWKSEVCK